MTWAGNICGGEHYSGSFIRNYACYSAIRRRFMGNFHSALYGHQLCKVTAHEMYVGFLKYSGPFLSSGILQQ
jgi:hypothetical protein